MFEILRKLAKSVRYQNLYSRAKELNNIRIFNNDIDFTYIQSLFLYYLELYSSLNTMLQSKEEYLSEEVINDWVRLEAFLLWRNRKQNKKEDKRTTVQGPQSVVFKRK